MLNDAVSIYFPDATLASAFVTRANGMSTRKLRFAGDSPVEGEGFEPSVPLGNESVSLA